VTQKDASSPSRKYLHWKKRLSPLLFQICADKFPNFCAGQGKDSPSTHYFLLSLRLIPKSPNYLRFQILGGKPATLRTPAPTHHQSCVRQDFPNNSVQTNDHHYFSSCTKSASESLTTYNSLIFAVNCCWIVRSRWSLVRSANCRCIASLSCCSRRFSACNDYIQQTTTTIIITLIIT